MLSGKYSDRVLMTVVQNSQYPVFKIDFPAIAVCTKHQINWKRIQKARDKFLPADASNETIEMFMSFAKRLDSFKFNNFQSMEGLENEPLYLINTLSISKIAQYLAFRCEEIMIGTCMFAGQPFRCCKNFIPEKTHLGMCLVFNSVVSPQSKQMAIGDKFYPYKNSKNGEGRGLVFMVKRNVSNEVPGVKNNNSGIELMIKKPDQWTEWKTYHLRVNTDNEIILQPQLTVAHQELKDFPLSFRKCLFEHEKSTRFFIPGLDYHLWNCKIQCYQDYLIKFCNCTIPLFFNLNGISARECTASDYICVYKNRETFSSGTDPKIEQFVEPAELVRGISCPCPPSCTSLTFPIHLNTIPAYNFSSEITATRVDIYYQSEVIMQYLTTLKYSIWDLTGYFGGIVTLFVGASLLTSVELIHFGILEICSCFRRKNSNKQLQGNPKIRGNMKLGLLYK
ncbi:pickpocket protein 19-like isoform X2 [Episyrphus balteatus]|nr:pickpocket protein 19-like isoform X2 [Episyrphus balteatus]XP_055847295.1 pickpocket protein 19-like isoform X2 [Episyrphus balteatus]XP_055847296.1 pickpocket protein 19-like isoform X2 [Episyrphus balteatus]XP_055847297.1 pickpocket protein 19-like isoform X2 [Episyrphus balteatus]XP_055847298.1 pickpocket protein 19-like isoform X2 [Episyrphus balteatus]XP_055847300.1 pickpocket protein 19-like isoform X2 [Episyrphus balteatus]